MNHNKTFRLDTKSIFITIPQIGDNDPKNIQKTAYDRLMERFKDKLDYLIVSMENHKDGGYHLHILIVLLKRFTTTKMDYFDFIADKHPNIQSARNLKDVIKYIIKDGDYLTYNIDPLNYLKDVNEKVKVVSKGTFYEVAEIIKNGGNIAEINQKYSGVLLKNSKHIMDYIKLLKQIENDEKTKEYYEDIYKNVEWNFFQSKILNIISSRPNHRKIHWVYDLKGNSGKSFLSTYLSIYKDAYIINGGKEQDIYYNYNNQSIVIFDLPRDSPMVSFDSIYRTMENFKNGYMLSTKYEGGIKRFIPPHIIVFSNELPNMLKMSEDRWDIINVEDKVFDKECNKVLDKVLDDDVVKDVKKDIKKDVIEQLKTLLNYGNLKIGDDILNYYTYKGKGIFYHRLKELDVNVV